MNLKPLSAKWRPLCLGLGVLRWSEAWATTPLLGLLSGDQHIRIKVLPAVIQDASLDYLLSTENL